MPRQRGTAGLLCALRTPLHPLHHLSPLRPLQNCTLCALCSALHLCTSTPRQATAHATEIGRLLGEEGLQQECREEPTPAALLRRVKQHWERTHVNTGRFCVRGSHEILMFGVGQWVLIKTPESRTPATCASLASLEPS